MHDREGIAFVARGLDMAEHHRLFAAHVLFATERMSSMSKRLEYRVVENAHVHLLLHHGTECSDTARARHDF